jgi:hypothetical protein
MFRNIVLVLSVCAALLVAAVTVEAGCRGGRCGGRGFFGGRAPVRSFFQNRQPVRRVVRGVARVVVAPGRAIVQRRAAIRQYRRSVAVASVPNQPVTQLGPVNQSTDQYVGYEAPTYQAPVYESECASGNCSGGTCSNGSCNRWSF